MGFIKKLDEHAEEYILGVFLVGIACIMMVQVVMRTIHASLSWAEELSRYLYVWSVFLSIACTVRAGNILRVSMFVDFIPWSAVKKFITVCLEVVSAAFYGALAYWGYTVLMAIKASGQTSPAMVLPTWIVYIIVPLGFALAAFRCLQQLYFILRPRPTEDIAPERQLPDEVVEALNEKGGDA